LHYTTTAQQSEAAAAAELAGEESDVDEETRALAGEIRARKKVARVKNALKRSRNKSVMPRAVGRAADRTMDKVTAQLAAAGVETSGIEQRGRKRVRSLSRGADESRGEVRALSTNALLYYCTA
jgi:hypothetical protein